MAEKMYKLMLELTESQYRMLIDCLQITEVKFRIDATAVESANMNYARRIKMFQDMVEKSVEEVP